MHLHGVKRIEVRIDVWLWPTTSQPTHSNPLRPLRPLRRLAILDHWYWYRPQPSRRLREWLLWMLMTLELPLLRLLSQCHTSHSRQEPIRLCLGTQTEILLLAGSWFLLDPRWRRTLTFFQLLNHSSHYTLHFPFPTGWSWLVHQLLV